MSFQFGVVDLQHSMISSTLEMLNLGWTTKLQNKHPQSANKALSFHLAITLTLHPTVFLTSVINLLYFSIEI